MFGNDYTRKMNNGSGMVEVTDSFGMTQHISYQANCCGSCGFWSNGTCCNRNSHCFNAPTGPYFTCDKRSGF